MIIVDANQRWGVQDGAESIRAMIPYNVALVEEPLSVHAPDEDWLALAELSKVPLATGENIMSDGEFRRYIESGAISHLQPDISKWGGITGVLQHARHAIASGLSVSPHMLSGGVGLLASAQVLAAVGGEGLQEWDCNDNPLRTDIVSMPELSDGKLVVPSGSGIGSRPDWSKLEHYRIDNS